MGGLCCGGWGLGNVVMDLVCCGGACGSVVADVKYCCGGCECCGNVFSIVLAPEVVL